MQNDRLVIAGREFTSRLWVGTGKSKDFAETRKAIEAPGADVVLGGRAGSTAAVAARSTIPADGGSRASKSLRSVLARALAATVTYLMIGIS